MDDKGKQDYKLELRINVSEVVVLVGFFGSLWLWMGWI